VVGTSTNTLLQIETAKMLHGMPLSVLPKPTSPPHQSVHRSFRLHVAITVHRILLIRLWFQTGRRPKKLVLFHKKVIALAAFYWPRVLALKLSRQLRRGTSRTSQTAPTTGFFPLRRAQLIVNGEPVSGAEPVITADLNPGEATGNILQFVAFGVFPASTYCR